MWQGLKAGIVGKIVKSRMKWAGHTMVRIKDERLPKRSSETKKTRKLQKTRETNRQMNGQRDGRRDKHPYRQALMHYARTPLRGKAKYLRGTLRNIRSVVPEARSRCRSRSRSHVSHRSAVSRTSRGWPRTASPGGEQGQQKSRHQ